VAKFTKYFYCPLKDWFFYQTKSFYMSEQLACLTFDRGTGRICTRNDFRHFFDLYSQETFGFLDEIDKLV